MGGFFVLMDGLETFLRQVGSANVIPVVESMPADLLTPLAVYLKLSADGGDSFLLESVEGGESLARYSFIGSKPYSKVTGGQHGVTVHTEGVAEKSNLSLWQYLRQHFSGHIVAEMSGLPSFIGGAIGLFDFSCYGWFEPATQKVGVEASAELLFFRSIVAFDHAKQTILLISLVFVDEHDPDDLPAAFQEGMRSNRALRAILEEAPLTVPKESESEGEIEIRSNWAKEDFEAAVMEVKERIAAGDCYQAVLSQRFARPTNASAVSIYRAMRSLNPSPYMFLLKTERRAIVGASPEMLVRVRGRNMEYRPIAGTRPRGVDAVEDLEFAEAMRRDTKEVSEHQMLVDLGRNDLGRVAKFGSVKVDRLMNVEKFSHVQHLVSYLTAEMADGVDRFDALAACFPAGTVSGAPKVRAVEIIQELEPTERGIYAGAVGYFDYAGNMDTCIAIRTLVLENGEATIQAGAGIVADSVPELEFAETVNKAKALFRAIEIAEGRNL